MKNILQNCARSKFFTGNRIKKFGVETLERNLRVWGTLSTHELFDLMLSPVHLLPVRKKVWNLSSDRRMRVAKCPEVTGSDVNEEVKQPLHLGMI